LERYLGDLHISKEAGSRHNQEDHLSLFPSQPIQDISRSLMIGKWINIQEKSNQKVNQPVQKSSELFLVSIHGSSLV
jgi:hypothetical protein